MASQIQTITLKDSSRQKVIALSPELYQVSRQALGWRVPLWFAGICAGFALAALETFGLQVLGVVVLGLSVAQGVELSHQALHNTGFQSRALNEYIGVLLGLPMLVSFYEYRQSHLGHHAKIGTPDDTEYFDYGNGAWTAWRVITWLFMLQHYRQFLAKSLLALRGAPLPDLPKRMQIRGRAFYLLAWICILLLVAVGFYTGKPLQPLLIWIVALVSIATPVHALIEMPEHYGCDHDTVDVLHNTRSMPSNRLMQWFTNGNNFHVEHHQYPNVPLQNARKVYEILAPAHRYNEPGYRDFYKKLAREIIKSEHTCKGTGEVHE